MRVINQSQYNQGISKNKLLSSTAGVGSIVTTQLGNHVLISDINKWKFLRRAIAEVSEIRSTERESEWIRRSIASLSEIGLDVVQDIRFVEFLRIEKDLENLIILVGIPHLALNERFNTIKIDNNPIIRKLQQREENPSVDDYVIPGTHFPKWFKNRNGCLKTYSEWKDLWVKKNIEPWLFAPPRDAGNPFKNSSGDNVTITIKMKDGIRKQITLYKELSQLNLILICPNGHLSDIPWARFLRWKTENRSSQDNATNLFEIEPCCTSPDLKWSESTTKSEGYGSIYIECLNCKMGSGDDDNRKVNLEGINNLKPLCHGQKPWEIDHSSNHNQIPFDPSCFTAAGSRERMQTSLVTGNNVYFANGFSSLFIPKHLIEGRTALFQEVLDICEEKFSKTKGTKFEKSRSEWSDEKINEEFLFENGLEAELEKHPNLIEDIKEVFVSPKDDNIEDPHEHYRWQEFHCFTRNTNINEDGLLAKDIDMPVELPPYFKKVQQIEDLQLSQVQLNFCRVRPSERVRDIAGNVIPSEGKEIFSIDRKDLFVIPANESLGEGIFFQFNEDKISSWYNANHKAITSRLLKLTGGNPNDQGASIHQKIEDNGAKQLLIHTFSHLFMRELEFSCGYSTASLRERLYISPRMSGLLVYTAEGSEGSMGGIIWQARPDQILQLITNSLNRANDCSSDPLCWESEGQGIFNLNLAACFSCSLVSETACEERNLALDRRILIDPEFGFFGDFN